MSSLPSYSGPKYLRRTSVTPNAAIYSRAATEIERGSTPTNDNRSSSQESTFNPAGKLHRMSTLFITETSRTKQVLKAAFEDTARTEYRKLKYENEHLLAEWKQLRKFIEQLQIDYTSTKQLDPLRRYKQLQAIAKRTVMHLRLMEIGSVTRDPLIPAASIPGSVVQSETKEREMEKRIMQLCDNYEKDELEVENRRLREINERYDNRIQNIVETINELDVIYHTNKNESIFKRYVTLRNAIKDIAKNPDLVEAP
ncbi:unnamed protein product [Dicrocoelium dendriticum]|nr:unnamed protein product [Dicrocoelium dendriticum]